MAYDETLAQRVREALAAVRQVEEKKMFGGLAFMVNGKMCINVSKDRLMCRIDPALHDDAVENTGIESVRMRGRETKGFIYLDADAIKSKKAFDYWISHSLEYNKLAKASTKSKPRK